MTGSMAPARRTPPGEAPHSKDDLSAVARDGWLTRRRECGMLSALLALAALLRLTLAARGWPILNSDEATMGLMGSDIALRGSHPIFFYAQDYLGALQAYLAAPVMALLGPTPLALRLVTTAEFVAFLLVIFALARALWSPAVALVSIAILALGPEWALLRQIQAGVAAQETLLFGALVVWLAFLRLGSPHGARRALALDLAFGLAAGLGLWSDFLFLPYLAAALLALACLAARDLRMRALRGRRALGEAALGALGFVVGAAPFIVANISSRGQTLRLAVALAQAHTGAAAPGLGQRLMLLPGQLGATLLVGLPQALGSGAVCPNCTVWPEQGGAIASGCLAEELLLAAPFSLLALGLWLWSAWPLAQTIRRRAPRLIAQMRAGRGRVADLPPLDARWWGRLTLALGAALTLLQYLASRTSYTFPASSSRYLIGLYICAPLVAAPLVAACAALWRWWRAPSPRWRGEPDGSGRARWAHVAGMLGGAALLLAILVINAAGATQALASTSDRQAYGEPMGQRDARLVAFLQAHHATDYYAGYWTCLRLVFTSQQQVNCYVISPTDAFAPGFNRYPPAERRTLAAAHPAWVFDLARGDEAPSVPAQVAACIAAKTPRCVGYTSATFDGYRVYYYAGATSPPH